MEIINKKSIIITPALNDGVIVHINNGEAHIQDQYVFTEWTKFFKFLNDFYTEDLNEKSNKCHNPWAVDGPVYGGGS